MSANGGGDLVNIWSLTATWLERHRPDRHGAAAPLWASLMIPGQHDLCRPGACRRLGYMNDLLYTAAVIAPADVQRCHDRPQHLVLRLGRAVHRAEGRGRPATSRHADGVRLRCGAGLRSRHGLGTPNGVLLARAMTWIAHSQMSAGDVPDCSMPTAAAGQPGHRPNPSLSGDVADRAPPSGCSPMTGSKIDSLAPPTTTPGPTGSRSSPAARLRSGFGSAVRRVGTGSAGREERKGGERTCREAGRPLRPTPSRRPSAPPLALPTS